MSTGTRSIAAGFLLLSSVSACNSGKVDVPVASVETVPAVALTDAMRAELGAAAWIREDAGYFSTTLRLREQWKALTGSRAFQKLMSLPAVQMARLHVLQSQIYQSLLAETERSPLLRSAVDLASDAFSREVFVYMGPELVPLLDALVGVYSGAVIVRFPWRGSSSGEPGSPEYLSAVLSDVLAREKSLRFPPIVIGFRLAAPDAARTLLSSALKEAGGLLPRPIEEEEIAGAKFHTLRLDLRMAPLKEARRGLRTQLKSSGVPRELVEKLDAFLDSQTLALSAGLRGDYLLLSAGASTAHLRTLGEGTSLAASRALAPVRKRFKPGVISLAYASAGLVSMQKLNAEDCASSLKAILGAGADGSLPEGFNPRLEKDVRGLVEDLNRGIPEPAPWISVSFSNSGIESYSFSARDLATDASRPLTILSRAGSSPLLAVASRAAPSREAYGRLAHWIGVAYGYFQDYVVPGIPPEDRRELDRFRKLFIPTIKSIHKTTEKHLLPALDGCQGLLAVDGGGLLPVIPGLGQRLSRPFKVPRPALVLELNDADKLVSAFSEYRETLSRFLSDAEKEFDTYRVALSPPSSRPHAGGTLFTYPLPETGLPDFEPHVLISGKHAVLSLSPAQSKDIIESTSQPLGRTVDLAASAGRGYWVDLAAASRLILDGAEIVLEEARKSGAMPPEGVGFLALHLPELRQVLSALKSLSGRSYSEDGATVHHSWLRVEDLSDG